LFSCWLEAGVLRFPHGSAKAYVAGQQDADAGHERVVPGALGSVPQAAI